MHRNVACRHSAVHPQHGSAGVRAPVRAHGFEQIAGLIANSLQRRARKLGRARVACKPEQRTARICVPPWGAQSDKSGDQIHFFRRSRLGSKHIHVGCGRDHLERVPQPLHRGTSDKDRAFQRIGARATQLVRNRREQPIVRGHRLLARVEEEEAPGTIGRLHHPWGEAALSDSCRLLVTHHAANAYGGAEHVGCTEVAGTVAHLREKRGRDCEQLAELRVPLTAANIQQQGTRCVARIGSVNLPAGQAPEEKGIDRAEGQPARFRSFSRAFNMVQNPGDLGRGEIGIKQQAGAR